jgi:uncharacterized membrane protein
VSQKPSRLSTGYKVLPWLLLMALGGIAFAKVTIDGPRTVEMAPGESQTVLYTISNDGEEPVEARIFFNDYVQQSNGTLQHIPAASLPQSLFGIADFGATEYVLAPGGSAAVPLTITVPQEPAGGYWGVIGVEAPPPPPANGQGNALTFNIRYAMVTSIEVTGVAHHEVSIDNLSALDAGDEELIIVTIRNSGNAYQRFELAISFEGAGGVSETIQVRDVVLPGLTIDYTVQVPSDLPAGPYGVFAVLEYQDGLRAEAVSTVRVDGP